MSSLYNFTVSSQIQKTMNRRKIKIYLALEIFLYPKYKNGKIYFLKNGEKGRIFEARSREFPRQ